MDLEGGTYSIRKLITYNYVSFVNLCGPLCGPLNIM